MSQQQNDAEVCLNAGMQLADAEKRITMYPDEEGVPVAILPQGMRAEVMTSAMAALDARAPTPLRRKGTATFAELDSFIDHVNRFKSGASVVFADVDAVQLNAVLNYHPAGAEASPAWGDHRSVYACPLSEQWQLWRKNDGVPMGQEAFGEFIEANMRDLAPPGDADPIGSDVVAPAKLLEVARNLIVRTKGEFSRFINPTTGEHSLVNKLENETSSTKIPRGFNLGIPVFVAGQAYRIEARLRFQMSNGRPAFTYVLVQPDATLRDAFGGVRSKVVAATGLPVLAGSPE